MKAKYIKETITGDNYDVITLTDGTLIVITSGSIHYHKHIKDCIPGESHIRHIVR